MEALKEACAIATSARNEFAATDDHESTIMPNAPEVMKSGSIKWLSVGFRSACLKDSVNGCQVDSGAQTRDHDLRGASKICVPTQKAANAKSCNHSLAITTHSASFNQLGSQDDSHQLSPVHSLSTATERTNSRGTLCCKCSAASATAQPAKREAGCSL